MKKEITMSINQFMEIERGNLSLDDIVQATDLETIAGKILKNTKLKHLTITTIALINMNITAHADETSQAISQIQQAENKIVPVILAIIGTICTIACIAQIGKSVMTRKGDDIGQIVMRYVLAFAGACSVPWMFRIIRSIFKLG